MLCLKGRVCKACKVLLHFRKRREESGFAVVDEMILVSLVFIFEVVTHLYIMERLDDCSATIIPKVTTNNASLSFLFT